MDVDPIIEKTDVLDIILLVGSPGAGKSSFYWRYLQPLGYGRVNQDILKTVSTSVSYTCMAARAVPPLGTLSNVLKQRENCVKAATTLINEGTSVVVGKLLRHPASSTRLCMSARILNVPR